MNDVCSLLNSDGTKQLSSCSFSELQDSEFFNDFYENSSRIICYFRKVLVGLSLKKRSCVYMSVNEKKQAQLNSKLTKSIAVLPFVNMSSDPENEYFSDGITEEIINALTTVQGLKVIARTSCFAFKGKNLDVRVIGNQLGVNTVLEGSVRKVSNRVRVTAKLICTDDGSHLWSKNFDRELEDIFALQDEISLNSEKSQTSYGKSKEIPGKRKSLPGGKHIITTGNNVCSGLIVEIRRVGAYFPDEVITLGFYCPKRQCKYQGK